MAHTSNLKLKTKLAFSFDDIEIDKDLSYDVEFKEKPQNIIKEVKLPTRNSRHTVQDASTKLF